MIFLEEQIYQKEIASIDLRYQQQLDRITQQIANWKEEIKIKSAQRDAFFEEARKEADGASRSIQRNTEPIYQLKKADADRPQLKFKSLEAHILPQ